MIFTMKKLYILIISLNFILGLDVYGNDYKKELLIYAPASLRTAMEEVISKYKKNINIKTVYMGTSILALQIKNGAKPDIFISANNEWMNYLEEKKLTLKKYRINFLYNSLVIVTNKTNKNRSQIKNIEDLKVNLTQTKTKISLAMTRSVPAGIYAKSYLININLWKLIKNNVVESPNVRAAMKFVSRGDLEFGIVYKSDAIAEKKVKILYNLEKNLHDEIIYPLVILNEKLDTINFYKYLKNSQSLAIINKWGFNTKND